jgi:hypothetical protein
MSQSMTSLTEVVSLSIGPTTIKEIQGTFWNLVEMYWRLYCRFHVHTVAADDRRLLQYGHGISNTISALLPR